jgi:uroporphyrinogen-III synthase
MSDFAHTLGQELQRSLSEHRVPVALTRDPTSDRRFRVFEHWSRDPGETSISVPLLSRKKLVGAINVRHAPHVYLQRDAKLLSTLGFIIGADIGISLAEAENAALGEDLETRNVVQRGKGLLQRDLRRSEPQARATASIRKRTTCTLRRRPSAHESSIPDVES